MNTNEVKKELCGVEKTSLQIMRDWLNKNVDNCLLTVPGLGPYNVKKLEENYIWTTSQLIGQFWFVNRDILKFVDFLEDMGIQNRYARDCADAMVRKFRDI